MSLTHLAEEGYDPFFGARPLKRLIQQDVVNMLSKAILEGKIPGRQHHRTQNGKRQDNVYYKSFIDLSRVFIFTFLLASLKTFC